MSEELRQSGLSDSGVKICKYEFYSIGNTTLNQLKKHKIIPSKNYREYGSRKPDALLVDRRNKKHIKVFLILEHKDTGKFKTKRDKKKTVEQCNDLCQVLGALVGVATDGDTFIWFNPNHPNTENEYLDKTTGKKRSYSFIIEEDGTFLSKPCILDQKTDEVDITKLSSASRLTIEFLEKVVGSIGKTTSHVVKEISIDPTSLARQIWQDVWSVSGATPEKCLYTFIELFIFKYLSDLGILTEDDKGNKINFKDIFKLSPDVAFKNYSNNAREYLKVMFKPSTDDNTTIINGTVLNPDVPEHSDVFYKILKKFDSFGEMKNIDPNFKSKVFEDFMKESISKKNWGQFFTPRNIIDAMIEISDIDKLEGGHLYAIRRVGSEDSVLNQLR
ncbi:MAG: hypothetical protein WCE90_00600 [Candidatus Zixiibacteriota bacterium]